MSAIRPEPDEYDEQFRAYVERVPDGDIARTLGRQKDEVFTFLRGLTEDVGWKRYADDKWSLREVVGHVIDCERMFGARALAVARGEPLEMPGFDGDAWVAAADHDERTLASLANEFRDLRASHATFFEHISGAAWTRPGKANGQPVTARALAWIMAGHADHHMAVIRERYL